MNRVERQELIQHVENCFEVFTEEELSALATKLCEVQLARARARQKMQPAAVGETVDVRA